MGEAIDSMPPGLRGEFSDLSDLADATRVALRLLLAALLGGLLGMNRERSGRPAGLRTHMLVAMGAALFVLVPQLAGMGMADLGRVIQGVIVGIGFLGAGTIVKHRDDEEVIGLTTAAGVFMTAAIGVACGLGRELTALVSTLLAWTVLALVQRLIDRRGGRSPDRPA